ARSDPEPGHDPAGGKRHEQHQEDDRRSDNARHACHVRSSDGGQYRMTARPSTSWSAAASAGIARPSASRWLVLLLAAAAMVGTLPGRTQGLGLITEPLLADLHISRISYATLNLWATIVGSAGAIGVGQLIDRYGSRIVLTSVAGA